MFSLLLVVHRLQSRVVDDGGLEENYEATCGRGKRVDAVACNENRLLFGFRIEGRGSSRWTNSSRSSAIEGGVNVREINTKNTLNPDIIIHSLLPLTRLPTLSDSIVFVFSYSDGNRLDSLYRNENW